MHRLRIRLYLLTAALLPSATAAQAANISGTISSTLTITSNSQLTGDVRCTVTSAPCIKFGASGITLNLNGHTITGNGGVNSCALTANERAIDTVGANYVSILGPGIVQKFNGDSIVVSGNSSWVKEVAVLSSCRNGIVLLGSYNNAYANTVDLSGLGGALVSAGIAVGGESNQVAKNQIAGAAVAILIANPFVR